MFKSQGFCNATSHAERVHPNGEWSLTNQSRTLRLACRDHGDTQKFGSRKAPSSRTGTTRGCVAFEWCSFVRPNWIGLARSMSTRAIFHIEVQDNQSPKFDKFTRKSTGLQPTVLQVHRRAENFCQITRKTNNCTTKTKIIRRMNGIL